MAQRIQYHWQLDVYELSIQAAMEIYQLSKAFPKEEIYSKMGTQNQKTTVIHLLTFSLSHFLVFKSFPHIFAMNH